MTPIPSEKLHTVWEWVEKGLYAVRAKTNQTWFPADVYVQLKMKTAHLLVVEDVGFVIYQILPGDDFRGVLHIWIVFGKFKPHEKQMYDAMDALGKSLGVARVRAIGRKGWGRTGYLKLTAYVFERDIL